jgi:molybdopterin/thiamine biosynthesis adenylyltransferase
MSARFTDEEVRRYSRQLVLPEVGGVGQERLRATRATARGEIDALYLAAAGVGELVVPSHAIADAVRALNPLVRVTVDARPLATDDVERGALRALAVLSEVLAL